ncbi:MAG: carboxy-S-adenosyl-L-methionine synthase CmoA [Woeseiaceae bacterium]
MERDTIYKSRIEAIKAFEFDEAVTTVFPDMIARSAPGYGDTLAGLHRMAPFLVPEGGRCYDLGCSLGASLLAVSMGLDQRPAELIGLDNSDAMVSQCHADERFNERKQSIRFEVADVSEHTFEPAHLFILNFTLQFLPPEDRLTLLSDIYASLEPGGALVISEKFRFEDQKIHQFLDEQHLQFKRQNDYSDLEIAGKRSALEDVLIADTRDIHRQRLHDAGFQHIELWQATMNFGSFVALK